jgi:hypothetical protein
MGDRGPDPPGICGAFSLEDAVNFSPSGDELARGIAVDADAPTGPVAVHLVGESQEEGPTPVSSCLGPPADVGVVLPG